MQVSPPRSRITPDYMGSMISKNRKKIVVFDLDGTLLNSLEDLADSANHVLAAHGFPTHPVSDYRYFVGDGVRKLIERILPDNCRSEYLEVCRMEFVEYYDIHKEDKTVAYAGVADLLTELNTMGMKIAVASNKVHDAVGPLMEKYFPGVVFDSVFGQRPGVPVKPDPRILLDILEKAGCKPEEAVHVGDTSTDITLAKNAGVESVGVTWGYRPQSELVDAGAGYIISEPSQLLDII